MSLIEKYNNRILIIDDNTAIHEDFRKILRVASSGSSPLLEATELVFGATKMDDTEPEYTIDSAYQGFEGLNMIQRASDENKPYALAFCDVRMPPGLDGVETISAIWTKFPEVQIVLCTAYSDYSWEDVLLNLGSTDKLLILQKPFEIIEVRQMACAMTAKWNLNRKRQHLIEELKEKNVMLENDIVARKLAAVELIEARKAADDANASKSMFLANMSHEIRTPMNAILGFNYLMQKTEMTMRQSDYTAKSTVAAKSLLGLINDILDLSKVEAGKIELERIDFNLDEVLSKVLQVTFPLAQQKRLEFSIEIAPHTPTLLIGDPLRLEQVLLNLSGNAIKFTKAGKVTVAVDLCERANSGVTLRFKVRDSGIGMNPAEMEKLFQPFVQANSTTTRKHGGTGLGLTISKNFVALMQGEIKVESTPGSGSVFSFTARFDERVEKERGALGSGSQTLVEKPEKSELKTDIEMRALVIDGDAESRKMLLKILADLRFDAVACATANLAQIEIAGMGNLSPVPLDLILLDGSDPGTDWLSDVLRLRERFDAAAWPKIILIVDKAMADQKMDCFGLGISEIVFKPLTRSAIFDAIARAQAKHVGRVQLGSAPLEKRSVLQGSRILLVDDEEINQEIATELLRMTGCNVTAASSGAEALSKIRGMDTAHEFDMVLMDLHMPDMDGMDVTRQIRAEQRFVDLPIIAMTADAIQGIQAQCLAAGMNDYLTKPINPEEMFATLARWIPLERKAALSC